MEPIIEKVTAFIIRPAPGGPQLLLFRHPHAGIQIPAGTVEAGESPEGAARREAVEETGLEDLRLLRRLGSTTETLPPGQGVISAATTVYSRPGRAGFDWATLRRGLTVTVERQVPGFALVTFTEPDQLEAPQFTSYQITGWIPAECLAGIRTRYFFLFQYMGEKTGPWWVETDSHRFEPFWAPLAHLPEIVPPQNLWLEQLKGDELWTDLGM